MNFFLVETTETEKLRKNKSCGNEFEGYDDFVPRRFGHRKGSKKLIKGQCTAANHGEGVGVKNWFDIK